MFCSYKTLKLQNLTTKNKVLYKKINIQLLLIAFVTDFLVKGAWILSCSYTVNILLEF